jgi:hypothetical protein
VRLHDLAGHPLVPELGLTAGECIKDLCLARQWAAAFNRRLGVCIGFVPCKAVAYRTVDHVRCNHGLRLADYVSPNGRLGYALSFAVLAAPAVCALCNLHERRMLLVHQCLTKSRTAARQWC